MTTEDDLWQQHVAALKAGIDSQQADAIERVKLEIRRLDGEIAAVANRRELLARTEAKTGIYGSIGIVVDARLAMLNKRMADLRDLLRDVRRVMLPDSPGPTPETRQKPPFASVRDLSEGLQAGAVELRCGWVVRQPVSQKVKAAQMERIGGPSAGDYGAVAETLERRYLGWAKAMARIGAPVWPVRDIVIEDRGWWEAAKLRRSDPGLIRLLVEAALTVYVIEFPDRLPQPE